MGSPEWGGSLYQSVGFCPVAQSSYIQTVLDTQAHPHIKANSGTLAGEQWLPEGATLPSAVHRAD